MENKISNGERARILEEMNRIAAKSKLTQKDVDELSEKIKKSAAERFRLFSK